MGRVRGEAAMGVERVLEAGEHEVEGVGQVFELVRRSGQGDAVLQFAGAGAARGGGDVVQGAQHAAGDDPPDARRQSAEHRQRGE